MKKTYEYESFNIPGRGSIPGILCLCLIMAVMAGCRKSQDMVEETYGEKHTTVSGSLAADTLHTAATSSEENTDSAEICAVDRAVIRIERDTAGRVIEIRTKRAANIRALAKRRTEQDRKFHGLNVTLRSEASDSVVSFAQTKKEEKKDYKFGTPLETYIGLSLCALIILFYIGDYIYRLWKRKWGK